MQFNSWEYFAFLLVVLTGYYCLERQWQNRMLLVASYFFYSCWDWRFSSLLVISTIIDYTLSLAIHSAEDPKRRKHLLFISIAVNFGMLAYFKYFNFFIDSAAVILREIGFTSTLPTLHIILPAGISFYTFQTMNYVVDVYRKHLRPTRDFTTYALFVSYFPHLVAGPIMRAERLLPQLLNKRVVTNEHINTGALLILLGLFKKVCIADSVAIDAVHIFPAPESFSTMQLWRGVYCFALQIYCDFSGYSDIARGTSRLFGIELMENFNQPYLSHSVTDFWRRWHISLSTWLRDYLYIPLGGNRRGTVRTYFNLMITMLFGGLWHGANWTFVIWGFLHGLYLSVHRCYRDYYPRDPDTRDHVALSILKMVFTFQLVSLTWVFFRAGDLRSALVYIHGLLFWRGSVDIAAMVKPIFFAVLLLILDLPQYWTRNHTVFLRWPWPVRGVLYTAMFFMLIVMENHGEVPFIYFQF